MAKFEINAWNKPSDPNWKLIADILLYTLPLVNGVILTMPISDTAHKWILVVTNLSIVFAKAVTKFTVKDEVYESETLEELSTN